MFLLMGLFLKCFSKEMKKMNIGKAEGPFKYLIVYPVLINHTIWYSNQSFSMPGDPLITDTQNTGRERLAGPSWSKPYRIVFEYCLIRRYYFVPHISNKSYWPAIF